MALLTGLNASDQNDHPYIKKFEIWSQTQKININELSEIREHYIKDCITNLKTYYDGSPLHGIVIEINQNYSISIWAETVKSHQNIVKRFKDQSSGYENQPDEEVYINITPWYYDSFKYSCLEFKCTPKVKPVAMADGDFCEMYEGEDLSDTSHEATIRAILNIEKSNFLQPFDRSKDFKIRLYSENNDTISKGDYCWATDKILNERRKKQ